MDPRAALAPETWWHANAGSHPPPSVERLPDETEVAIIGGGMMGVSLARWLALDRTRPLVLEAAAPASAASGRNGGLVVVGAHDEFVELEARLGVDAATEIVRGTVENHALIHSILAERGLERHWIRTGYVALWSDREEADVFVRSAPRMRQVGWDMEILDHDGCEDVMGVRLDSRLQGGAWTPGDASLNPVTLVYALAQAAHQAGARFSYHSPVLGLEPSTGAWKVHTARGPVRARHVVVAANQRVGDFVPELASVIRVGRGIVAATSPLPRPIRAAWAEHGVAPYGRPLASGGMIVGSFSRIGRVPPDSAEQLLDPTEMERQLNAYVLRTFPELVDARIERVWSGTLGSSTDRLPIVGAWPKASGLWLLAGFGGQGIPFSLWAPRLLAKSISAEDSSLVPWYFSPGRFVS